MLTDLLVFGKRYKNRTLFALTIIVLGFSIISIIEFDGNWFSLNKIVSEFIQGINEAFMIIIASQLLNSGVGCLHMVFMINFLKTITFFLLMYFVQWQDLKNWFKSDKFTPLNISLILFNGVLGFIYYILSFWIMQNAFITSFSIVFIFQ